MLRITQILKFVEGLWALGEATAGLNDQAAAATSFHQVKRGNRRNDATLSVRPACHLLSWAPRHPKR